MMKKVFLTSFWVLALKTVITAEVIDTNLFIDVNHGLKIRKPASWHFIDSKEILLANVDSGKINDEEIKEQVKHNIKYYNIVKIRKFKEPYEGINPGVGIVIKPLSPSWKKLSNIKLVKETVATAKKVSPDLIILQKAKRIKMCNFEAATITYQCSFEMKNGKKHTTLAKLILFKKGMNLCRIGISLPQNPSQEDQDTTEAILKSLEIK